MLASTYLPPCLNAPMARFFSSCFMLKSRVIPLVGRDEGTTINLTELPALVADRHARTILKRLNEDLTGGIATLALRHTAAAVKLGTETLLPFVSYDLSNNIRDWRNVQRIQQAALLLHVDFLFNREVIEVPIALQAEHILLGGDMPSVSFCSAQIAAVMSAGKASYVELETVLSTEDVYNLCEMLNVNAIRDWYVYQRTEKK